MATKDRPKGGAPGGVNGPAPTPGEVLTLAEAAALLRVPEEGLRQDASAGRVPGRLVAGEWRFTRTGLLDWLSRPESPTGPARTGAELVRRLEAIDRRYGVQEAEEEAEAFIAKIYAARRADPVGG